MRANLKCIEGNFVGKSILLTERPLTVGRGKDCHVQLGTHSVSRHHCDFFIEKDRILVRDLQSTNGTYVNERRIVGEVELLPGDAVRVGQTVFKVEVEDAASATPKTRPAKPVTVADDDDVLAWLAKEAKHHHRDSSTRVDSPLPQDISDQMLARELSEQSDETGTTKKAIHGNEAAAMKASDLLRRLSQAAKRRQQRRQ